MAEQELLPDDKPEAAIILSLGLRVMLKDQVNKDESPLILSKGVIE